MNNKKLGSKFEKDICQRLAKKGYWVHFIVPDIRGAQPFDIIAVKDGKAVAIDCKTCVSDVFSISRLEENQVMAFEKWIRCGNTCPVVVVEHDGIIICVEYNALKEHGKIRIGGCKHEEIQSDKYCCVVAFDDFFY